MTAHAEAPEPPNGISSSQRLARTLLPAACAAALLAGFVVRVSSMGESLWLDELSTLWSVEGSFGEMLHRTPLVMGLTPFYFVFPWLSIHTFGESEWALRLPSLLAVIGATAMASLAAFRLAGRRAALWTAMLFWLSYPAVWTSVDARPYAFPMFFGALLLWGWIGSCQTGAMRNRAGWVLGSAGLVWSNLVFAPFALAGPVAYVIFPSLRLSYAGRQFATDAGVTVVLLLPAAIQLMNTMSAGWAQGWALEPSHLAVPALLVPFAFAMLISSGQRPPDARSRDLMTMLWLAIGIQIVALEAGALAGRTLLAARYGYVIVTAAAVIAGCKLARLRGADLLGPVAVYVIATGVAFQATRTVSGSWSGAGYQEWREAVEAVRGEMTGTPGAPVLFRSGNAQDDLSAPGEMPWPATLAPLRSPGEDPPNWEILPLTYRWHTPAREAYFDGALVGRLEREPVFYLLCLASQEPGGYCPEVESWIANRWPATVTATRLGAFRQLTAIRFDRTAGPSGEHAAADR